MTAERPRGSKWIQSRESIVGKTLHNRLVEEKLPYKLADGTCNNKRYRIKCLSCGLVSTASNAHQVRKGGCPCQRKSGLSESQRKRRSVLRNIYGLSHEAFLALVGQQDNKCKLCKKEFIKTPCVDHDHNCCPGKRSCGKCVRGLLCRPCNRALGNFKDDPQKLREAAVYLEENARKF